MVLEVVLATEANRWQALESAEGDGIAVKASAVSGVAEAGKDLAGILHGSEEETTAGLST